MEKLAALFKECRKKAPPFERIVILSEQPDIEDYASAPSEEESLQTSAEERKQTSSCNSYASRDTRGCGKRNAVEADPGENRTVFVGNLPMSMTKRKLRQLFSSFGKIETVRFRSAAVAQGKLPVRVARRLHRQLVGNTINSYVVFSSEEDANKSLTLNGHLVDERHIRVDQAKPTKNVLRTVFVGNLPFAVDEEQLRGVFQ